MRPLVSVVIPVYNKEAYVARALASVLDQSYPELEVLVVDDASQDDSLARVAEFDDPRIRVLKRKTPGAGGYAARNLGIENALGEWVAFLDADDVWRHDHLDNSMAIAACYPDIPVISAARLTRKGDQQWLDPFAARFMNQGPQVLSLDEYLKFACQGLRAIGTNSILIKRRALATHAVFPEGRTKRSGDLYAWVTLLAMLRVMVWSPHVASVYHGDMLGVSRTSVPSIELFRDMVKELRPHISHDDEKWLRLYANKMIQYAWVEQKKQRMSLSLFALPGSFFWKSNVAYCLKWTLVSLVPFGILERVKRRSQTE